MKKQAIKIGIYTIHCDITVKQHEARNLVADCIRLAVALSGNNEEDASWLIGSLKYYGAPKDDLVAFLQGVGSDCELFERLSE